MAPHVRGSCQAGTIVESGSSERNLRVACVMLGVSVTEINKLPHPSSRCHLGHEQDEKAHEIPAPKKLDSLKLLKIINSDCFLVSIVSLVICHLQTFIPYLNG